MMMETNLSRTLPENTTKDPLQFETERLQLGEWCFEPERDRICREGQSIKLEPQLARLLHFLARGAGHVLTKEEILDGVWGTRIVADSALTRAMAELRRALGDDAHHPRYIETIPKRGYRMLVTPQAAKPPVEVPAVGPPSLLHRRATLVVLSMLALFVNGGYARTHRLPLPDTTLVPTQDLRLAVLPLDNLSHDPNQDFFASGMTEALITRLAQIHSVSVISRRSVEPFRGAEVPLPQIAEALNIDLAIEGSVSRAEGRVRINVQLTDLNDGAHLWAASYQREAEDVLRLQSDVALAIAQEIRSTLMPTKLAERVDPEAYELYLKGRQQLMQCQVEGENEATGYFEAALDIDPGYAPAYAGMADYYTRLAIFGHARPKDVLPQARASAQRALELDSELAEAYSASAMVRFTFDHDWQGAESDFSKALELSPGNAWLRYRYALFLACLGRFDEALIEARRAIELDPLTPEPRYGLAWVHLNARQYEPAIAELDRVAELGLSDKGHSYKTWALGLSGRYEEAIVELETSTKEDTATTLGVRVWILARAGRNDEAQKALSRLLDESDLPEHDYGLALAYAGLGKSELAIAALERAYAGRSPNLVYLKIEPFFDVLQPEPRYQQLRRALGLS